MGSEKEQEKNSIILVHLSNQSGVKCFIWIFRVKVNQASNQNDCPVRSRDKYPKKSQKTVKGSFQH